MLETTQHEPDDDIFRNSPVSQDAPNEASDPNQEPIYFANPSISLSVSPSSSSGAPGIAVPNKRARSQLPVGSNRSANVRIQTLSAMPTSMENIHSTPVNSSHDKIDEFANFISSSLRQMPADITERAMAQLQYCMSVINNEAVSIYFFELY